MTVTTAYRVRLDESEELVNKFCDLISLLESDFDGCVDPVQIFSALYEEWDKAGRIPSEVLIEN